MMTLLFNLLRIHQVFGANTDVGKTVLTSALVRASAASNKCVYYLKPISSGPRKNADDDHVKRHTSNRNHLVHTDCLFRFQDPVSPHLAAKLAVKDNGNKVFVPSDEVFVNSIANYIRECASSTTKAAHMYIETAGGVHSPTLSGTTQLDNYRPLFLPTILVGDAKLGGISCTISAYESLLLRGYIVDSVLLFREDLYRNWEYLTPYFAERGVHVAVVDAPPPRMMNAEENFISTEDYYKTIVPKDQTGIVFDILRHLDKCHALRLEQLSSMPRRTLASIWWPFVQHGLVRGDHDVTVIDSAWSDFFSVYRSYRGSTFQRPSETRKESLLEPQFDSSASWWTQALGHSHPSLAIAAARAAGRYGHVMFPQATHSPALMLAERLLHHGPGKGWASRAYFSDNGSTGMEIALKMALRAFSAGKGHDSAAKKQLGIIGLKGSYHGDTIGAMDACEEGVYTCEWHNAKGYWFEPPTVSIRQGKVVVALPSAIVAEYDDHIATIDGNPLSWVYDIPKRLVTPLAEIYRGYIRRTLANLQKRGGPLLAALVLEPLVMGAAGMIFVDPLFQRIMVDVVRSPVGPSQTECSGIPIIFDEVFVGLYRLGMQSTTPLLGVNPDISVYAKTLTGGLVPLAVTLASDSIFQVFRSENKTDALLHGHSYTAHPIGCEVANETLDIVEKLSTSNQWKDAQAKWRQANDEAEPNVWSFWDPDFVDIISHAETVAEVMTMGTVLAFKVKDEGGGYGSTSAQMLLAPIKEIAHDDQVLSSAPGGEPFSIHFRTLGDVAYFMTSLNTPPATIRQVEDRILKTLQLHSLPSRE